MLLRTIVLAVLVTAAFGCKKRTNNESNVKNADSSADVLSEKFGLRVNLTTNMATFFESGKAIRRWKVATARDDGKSATPEGRFRFHELTTCVPWISTRNGASTGPCSDDNPLGYRAMWFVSSFYGLHGVDSSHIESVTATTADERRQSSGCVRNHPNDIKWLTDKVSELYGTTPAQLAEYVSDQREATFSPVKQGLALEVGRWSSDPALVTGSGGNTGQDSACTAANATGFVLSASQLDVFDDAGKKIGVSKPYEIVCPTKKVKGDKTQVFFPNDPSGFAWITASVVRQDCKGNAQWPTLAKCLGSGDPAQCKQLCAAASTPTCTDPDVTVLSENGRAVTFVHGEGSKYRPTAVVDSMSERKDGLLFKLRLRHSDTDQSNLAFDTRDNGKTLIGFRYDFAWAPKAKTDFVAQWNCDRWVGTLGTEPATLTP